MAKRATYTTEDTTALPEAVTTGLETYRNALGNLSINDMIMAFDGSKSELAQALSGTTDKGSAAYKSQMKNISRWVNYEKGERGKQARSTGRAGTQERFKDLRAKRTPPSSASVTITGWIGYDDKFYYRTISTSLPGRGVNTAQLLDSIQAGDTRAAYDAIFSAYGVGKGVLQVSDDNPQVDISFT